MSFYKRVLIGLYECLMALCSIVAFPLFLLSRRGRIRLFERIGVPPLPKKTITRWWHAASVGELSGLLPILQCSGAGIGDLVTVSSASALSIAVPPGVILRIAPFDSALWYKLLFARSGAPRSLVLTETEIWPGMLRFISRSGGKIAWVNMRTRAKSLRWYRMVNWLLPDVFSAARLLASSEADRERLANVFPQQTIEVLGNSKYDRVPSVQDDQTRVALRIELGLHESEMVLILSSLHFDEAQQLLPALLELMHQYPALRVIVAPRHRERDTDIAKLCSDAGIVVLRRSVQERFSQLTRKQLYLVDTFGELERLYSISTIVFVGGSLNHVGGHNPLEAAQYGVPLIMGPHREVVAEIAEQLEVAHALFTVRDAGLFKTAVMQLMADASLRTARGQAALEISLLHRGAATRIVSALSLVPASSSSLQSSSAAPSPTYSRGQQ